MGDQSVRVRVSLAVVAVICCLIFPLSLQAKTKSHSKKVKSPSAPASVQAQGMAGDSVCQNCHEESFQKFQKTLMGRSFLKKAKSGEETHACESCHGPGKAHAEAGGGKGVGGLITFGKNDPTPVKQRNEICLQCHQKGERLFWEGGVHESRDVACTNCHKVMENVTDRAQLAKSNEIETCGQCHVQKRAQQMRFTHMPLREGKMTCSSCHNPHGTPTPKLLKTTSVNETCYTCHAEKRGPFLWEHPPVMESCTNCHDAHGSNHEKMLNLPKSRVCQQCHDETRHPTNPQRVAGGTRTLFGRACTNCHFNVHGSNHPSGNGFVR